MLRILFLFGLFLFNLQEDSYQVTAGKLFCVLLTAADLLHLLENAFARKCISANPNPNPITLS